MIRLNLSLVMTYLMASNFPFIAWTQTFKFWDMSLRKSLWVRNIAWDEVFFIQNGLHKKYFSCDVSHYTEFSILVKTLPLSHHSKVSISMTHETKIDFVWYIVPHGKIFSMICCTTWIFIFFCDFSYYMKIILLVSLMGM